MRRSIIILLSASLLLACVKKEEKQNLYGSIFTTRVELADTKTELTGSSIRFIPNDAMTVVCEGFNKVIVSNKGSENPNIFRGKYRATGESGSNCNWYAVYPESIEVGEAGIISGKLSSEQTAPFDPKANIMYSDIIVADYDEVNQPNLSFQMNQMMGLIRISFVNDNEEYADDILQSVQLRTSVPLSGDFSMNIHSGDLTFEGKTYQFVTSVYSLEETMGVDSQHWVTLFVNPVKITGAKLIIRTDKHTFTYTSKKKFTPITGAMTLLPLMNLEEFVVEGPTHLKKRIACWGDSYTSANYEERATYCKHLQILLGEEWEVFNGGISGNRTDEIAARQGALPVVTGSAFTIPASGSIQIDGVLKRHNILGNEGYYPIRTFGGAQTNPCKLIGTKGEEVLCNINSYRTISGTDTTYYATLSRVTAGAPVEIAEHTKIETYAARELKDVDLTIIYMGTNGSFGSNRDNDRYRYNNQGWKNLADQHWEMINFADKSDSYIVLGKHNGGGWDNSGYSTYLSSEFGNRYLNLRLPVVASEATIKGWLIYSGLYADESEIPQEEINYALGGNWPRPLSHTPTDSHPNDYGTKVIAKIVYDRMVELGYLND